MDPEANRAGSPVAGRLPHQEGYRAGLSALIARYLQDLLRQLDGVSGLLEARDFAAIGKEAHRIKGTAGTYGLSKIAEGFASIELLAGQNDFCAVATALSDIKCLVKLRLKEQNAQG